LTCREPKTVAATGEQELAGLAAGHSEILVDGLPRLLGQLEANRATGLLLADRCSIERVTVGSHVIDAHRDDIAAAQLLSMARLNSARSRVRSSSCSFVRIDQTWLARSGGFAPITCLYSTADGPADWSMGSLHFLS
jgi:hypothetical protein